MAKTLLILGSKPNPQLPPNTHYDHLACANASGHSAARLGLPVPELTVISAIVTSGIASGNQSLRALQGLSTNTLYYYPRPHKPLSTSKRLFALPQRWRSTPRYFQYRLNKSSYQWRHLVIEQYQHYQALTADHCRNNAKLLASIAKKTPSTGIMALILGMSLNRYERYILSGFSFELTHAYAHNPEIGHRGTLRSRHAETDSALLKHLALKYGNIFTTEPTVHHTAGIPLIK